MKQSTTATTYKIGRRLRIAPDGGDTPSAEQLSNTQSRVGVQTQCSRCNSSAQDTSEQPMQLAMLQQGFKIFLDIDMTNSFHQFPLTELSSQRLAIQSPCGLVEPIFLPEGVSPASGHLQWTMMCCGKLVLRLKPLHSRHKKGSKSLIVIKS